MLHQRIVLLRTKRTDVTAAGMKSHFVAVMSSSGSRAKYLNCACARLSTANARAQRGSTVQSSQSGLENKAIKMEEKFKTVDDVADWLRERGFPHDVVEAFIGESADKIANSCFD